jgi:acetate kinase
MLDAFMNILTIKSGSSSIKFSLYRMGMQEELQSTGSLLGIGFTSGLFRVKDGPGKNVIEKEIDLRDHDAAFSAVCAFATASGLAEEP